MKLDLSKIRQKQLEAVNKKILSGISDESIVNKLYNHVFQSEGKKLRSLLTVLASESKKDNSLKHRNNIIQLASVIELLHSATLVHDDIVDDAKVRRGVETVNKAWTNSHGVLIGDFIYSKAFIQMVKMKNIKILTELANATNAIAKGEILQLEVLKTHKLPAVNQLIKIAYLKTGRLFEAAAMCGGIVGKYSLNQIKAIASFGKNLGIAFQIKDDLLDYDFDKKIGKEHFKDFSEGKYTLPLREIMRSANKNDVRFLKNHFGSPLKKSSFNQLKKVLSRNSQLIQTRTLLNKYLLKAHESINKVKTHPNYKEMLRLIEYSSLRSK